MKRKGFLIIICFLLILALSDSSLNSQTIKDDPSQYNPKVSDLEHEVIFLSPSSEEIITIFYKYTIRVYISTTHSGYTLYGVELNISSVENPEEIYISTNMNREGSTHYWNYSFDPIHLPNNQYNLTIKFRTSVSTFLCNSTTFSILNAPPSINFITPAESETISQKRDLNINVSVSDGENNPIQSVQMMFYSSNINEPEIEWVSMFNQSNGYYNYTIDPSDYSNGEYRIRVNASDEKGFTIVELLIIIDIDIVPTTNNNSEREYSIWIIIGVSSVIAGMVGIFAKHKIKKSKQKMDNIPINPKARASTPNNPMPLTREEKLELETAEKEILVEKEKFMCVVHRGLIDGNIYLCPNCKTLYCSRCAELLKNKKENCWNCNSPLGKSIYSQ